MSCGAADKNERKENDEMFSTEFSYKRTADCEHNDMLDCKRFERNCGSCGFNPEVAQQRIARFKQQRGIE